MDGAIDTFSLALAGGGTGGHLVPGLHLLRWFERSAARPDRCTWFTSGRAIEDRVLRGFDARGTALRRVPLALEPVGGGAPSLLRTGLRTPPETWRARRELVRARADVLVGLGGFTSLPPILAARSLGIPVVLLEINAVPGRATRSLTKLARVVVHAWPASVPPDGGPPHDVVLGPPLDPRLAEEASPEEVRVARSSVGLAGERPLLVVLGGSQGALGVNRFVATHARALVDGGLDVLHQVGPGRLAEGGPNDLARYRAVEYVEDVPALLGAARLVLARGGASTLAEVAARRVPALVVPYPHHPDRHQERNARALGDGVQIVDEAALGEGTVAELLHLAGPDGAEERARLRRALEGTFDRRAGARLAALVASLATGTRSEVGAG